MVKEGIFCKTKILMFTTQSLNLLVCSFSPELLDGLTQTLDHYSPTRYVAIQLAYKSGQLSAQRQKSF